MLAIVEQYSVHKKEVKYIRFHMIISLILQWKKVGLKKQMEKSINQL